jgi:hypothetical protein
VQEETFSCAAEAVAFGVYVPSHMFIICILYHCLIPSALANLSATYPSSLIKVRKIELKTGIVGLALLWPRVEVLS